MHPGPSPVAHTTRALPHPPPPADVRPPHILAAALALVKARWVKDEDYHYACSQLKGIRQVGGLERGRGAGWAWLIAPQQQQQ